MSLKLALLVGAGVIIAGLAFYAGRLLWMVKAQREAQQQLAAQKRQRLIDQNQKIWLSIDTICRATQQGQCCSSEAAIRLCVLLDNLAFSQRPDLANEFPGLHGLSQAIKHHPTHDARKSYSKKEIRQLDREREQLEQEFDSQIQLDLNQLLKKQLPLIA
ncbi:DUF2489 domain-containing protein [Neiella sp. HB171785]|uniref:DUF2489 domain-containing protein n=1 Tax=Neiella litorisoli TaxID=2771431 RepID=A0A8J6QHN5_9GAMM|nr:DUF2489 domain-containing protein [Neiella litorisoli]MBD1387881.1 DUF2489 domain-containing protein [Neiella litorisoli]